MAGMNDLTPRAIAAIRTAAPLVWAAFIGIVASVGLDLPPWALVVGPLGTAFVLWLVAAFGPSGILEQLLLLIRIDGYRYEQAGQLVTDNARVDVADLPALTAGDQADDFVVASIDAVLRRRPDVRALEMASMRLDDEIRQLRGRANERG